MKRKHKWFLRLKKFENLLLKKEMENFRNGTIKVAQVIAEATEKGAVSVIGGGDSVSAVKMSGLEKSFTHISTGGGASLEFMAGKELPGILSLTDKEKS